MGLIFSVPLAPGIHYTPRRCHHRPRGGCTLFFLTALVIAVLLQYWQVTVVILAAVGVVLLSGWYNQRRAERGLPTGPTIRSWLGKRRKP